MEKLKYRITGPQSIQRIEPLLKQLGRKLNIDFQAINNLQDMSINQDETGCVGSEVIEIERDDLKFYFVWETFCEKEWKIFHTNSCLLNRLSNSMVMIFL